MIARISLLHRPSIYPQIVTVDRWAFGNGDEPLPDNFVLKRLNRGKLYETYLLLNEARDAMVVAKFILPHRRDDERAQERLRAEAEALLTLNHPSIVKSLDVRLEGPLHYVILEHVEGPNLRNLLNRYGPLSIEQVTLLGATIAPALVHLEAKGFVHLDVKPSNIVMSQTGKLIDLGLIRRIEHARSLRKPVGTDAYMAPEQCDPAATGGPGPPADVWGLGATLHHSLSGSKPFPRPKSFDRTDRYQRFPQLYGPPSPLPRHVPLDIAAVIENALDPDEAGRPSAAELAATFL